MSKILFVEDTDSIAMLYTSFLRKAGFDVIPADTAAAAEDAFLKHEFDLVLMDLGLPDKDGLELLSDFLLRKPKLRVIVITANGSMNKAVEAMRLGAADFLVKPVSEDKFITAVEYVISKASIQEGGSAIDVDLARSERLNDRVKPLIGLPFEQVERALIEATIRHCHGSLPKAAELLELAPSTLYRKKESWKS